MKQAHTIRAAMGQRADGFTLVEVIVALTVLAVALSSLMAMYGFSLQFSNDARDQMLAAEMAEARLAALITVPEAFDWHIDVDNAATPFVITISGETSPFDGMASQPDVTVLNRNAHRRNALFYEHAQWHAWGQLPSPDAQAYEVTVAVAWRTRGREKSLALTSSVPQFKAPRPADAEGVEP